ncbi:alpha/beta fold hydrolase [Shewanella sp. LC6]|uniref:alpha/beta fold hydrolase n=1 Tax=unclassified Shewanella TaxID=196818 RepID=UPI0006DACAB6|nr:MULTISPECIES: alpha/beta fold hydrolase [unclassified Shewanella]ASF15027.1 dienelactone hydrolase [Shewanella sp. FDAARGOS_354]KPN76438.1 dienelactone hydrolase [Shewanella sp. Sh95]QQK60805.1 alpha/beta fold hydrolase [Shewanella sp. LC6]TPE59718.1 alpha/beta fold hydrolase [Shewanella sp. LC2]
MSCCPDNPSVNVALSAHVLEGEPSEILILFAHGAGANRDSDFMCQMAAGLVAKGFQVMRFNFPYMQANAMDGKKRPPDRAPKLLACFSEMLDVAHAQPKVKRVVLMGKSMGGRMAALLACDSVQASRIDRVICLGYPFIPLKGGEPRLEPLNDCQVPVLVLQGERDKFGGKMQIPTNDIQIEYLADGDHSFVPRKSSGTTEAANLALAVDLSAKFIG